MIKKTSWLLCASLLGAMANVSAAELASGSTTVTGLAYHLVDLDPNDGITPWVTFNNNHVGAGAYLPDGTTPFISLPGDAFSATAGSYTSPDGKFTASYSPTAQTGSLRLDSTDIQDITPDDGSIISNGGLAAGVLLTYGSEIDPISGLHFPGAGETTWTLSPNTALIVDGTAMMTAKVDLSQLADGGLIQSVSDGQNSFNLEIFNQVYIQLTASDGSYQDLNPSLRTSQDFMAGAPIGEAQVNSDSMFFSLRLDNSSAEAMNGYLDFTTVAFASLMFQTVTVPEIPPGTTIPEPSSCVLMGLGLGFMAWRVRTARRA